MRALLVLAVLLSACRREDLTPPALAVGRPAPAFAVRTLAGDTVRSGPGQPLTLVNLWATWCIPCRREFPTLERLQRDYGPRGLRVVAVSVDQGRGAAVADFARVRRVTFTIGLDPSGRTQRLFQAVGLPESYLIGTDGRLLFRKIGAVPPDAAALRALLDSLLPGTAAGSTN